MIRLSRAASVLGKRELMPAPHPAAEPLPPPHTPPPPPHVGRVALKASPVASACQKAGLRAQPGWKGMSNGANCRAAGEAGRRQPRGRDHLVMRQLRISWDIIAGLPSRLLEVPGLPLVNQR